MVKIESINLIGTNSYIISSNEAAIIVDIGGRQNAELLCTKIIDDGLSSKIKLIILTHGHYDHIEGMSCIREKLGIPVLMHRDDIHLIGKTKYQLHTRTWLGKVGKRFFSSPQYVESFIPDIIVGDEDYSLEEWGLEGKVIYTPGHTCGSISILCGDGLVAGDTFMNIFRPSETLFAEDYSLYDSTLTEISKYEFTNIYPGHGKPFRCNILNNYNKR